MKAQIRLGCLCVLALLAGCQNAQHSTSDKQHSMSPVATRQGPAELMQGVGPVYHAVSTSSSDAQKFFNQGLAYCYAFNHAEAVRSFQRAFELDPKCAMAKWGEALALGPNINAEVDPEAEKAAYNAVQKALVLSFGGITSQQDRDYIAALVQRYSNDSKADLKRLAETYRDAMEQLSRKYPDDLDAATLFAESAMDLRPWKLWKKDGTPEQGTEQIVATLESVLKRDPNHVGANHYYIHAVEASPHPERAMESARRLPLLAPAAGHLVHMPAHIYMRVGDYADAVRANQAATKADEEYFACCHPSPGIYPLMYYNHNRHFLAVASCMRNQSATALAAADALGSAAREAAKDMPMLEGFATVPILIRVRFAKWDDLLKSPAPDAKALPMTNAAWHFGRGMALAARGKPDQAQTELAAIRTAAEPVADHNFGNSTVGQILSIGEHLLAGRIKAASTDWPGAIDEYRQSVAAQDALNYDEPAPWPWSVRENLGGALLKSGDASGAEEVFRDDLKRNPNNPRSLLGLAESLRAQGKTDDARTVSVQAQQALQPADVRITAEDL